MAEPVPRWRRRGPFVGATMALTAGGLVVAGDPAAQWWAIAAPLLLLVGPVPLPGRARRRPTAPKRR